MFNELKDRIKRFWTLTDPNAFQLFGGFKSGAGIDVNDVSTLGLPPFKKAKELIGNTCARLSVPVYRIAPNGNKTEDKKHPAYALLNQRANPFQSAIDCKARAFQDAVGHGNGFVYINRDEGGRPVSLHNLDPNSTALRYQWNAGEAFPTDIIVYSYTFGMEFLVPYSDVIHIKGVAVPNFGGFMGVNMLVACKEILGLGLATINYGSHFYGNDCAPGMYIEMPGGFQNETQVKQFMDRVTSDHKGTKHAGKVGLLTNGAKFIFPPADNRKNQWVESMEMLAIAVSNLTGIPPHKLGANISTSYSSLEQENIAMYNDCIDAWLVKAESEYWDKLLTEAEKKSGSVYILHKREELTRNDTTATTETLLSEFNAGAITLNEYNRIKGRPTAGADGDRRRIPTNTSFDDMPAYDPDAEKEKQEAQAEALKQPKETEPTQDDDKVKALSASVGKRFIARIAKCLEKPNNRTDKYLSQDFISQHLPILIENVTPIVDRQIAEDWLFALRDELQATTSDKIPAILQRAETILGQLLCVN